MSDESRITLDLREPVQAYADIIRAWQWVKAHLMAGHWIVLVVRLATRSDAQNRLLHSRLGDVAKWCEWAGSQQEVDTWRRLFTSAWLRTQGQQVQMLPALDGHGIDIVYASTTKLSRAQCVELSDYILAWGDEREVPWRPASLAGLMDAIPPPARRARAIQQGAVDADGVITTEEEATA